MDRHPLRNTLLHSCLFSLALLLACSESPELEPEPEPTPDAATPDASTPDAATFDAGTPGADADPLPDPCADVTCERGTCAGGQCVDVRVRVSPLFETAGVLVTEPEGEDFEAVHMAIRLARSADLAPAQPLVRFDRTNWAASLFDLTPGEDHVVELRIERAGQEPIVIERPFTTRSEELPAPARTLDVQGDGALAAALADARAGDLIVLAAGTYAPFSIEGLHGTPEAPVVLRSAEPGAAIVDGAGGTRGVYVEQSSHVVLDGLTVRGVSGDGGIGVYLRSASRITLQNSVVEDSGYWNVHVSKSHEYDGPGGWTAGGGHVIQDNTITSSAPGDCAGASNSRCPGQTYYGIELNNNPGGDMVIRRNTVTGHVDNIVPCGDENVGRDLTADVDHVLAITQDPLPARGRDVPGTFLGHNVTVSENVTEGGRDDNLEADGVCVNARFVRNRVLDAHNAITIAPVLPGPFYFVRNVVAGDFAQSPVKMNTAGNPDVPSRHVYFFHNTFVRTTVGESAARGIMNLWYAKPGDHDVPLEDVRFENNVFASLAPDLVNCTSASIGDEDAEHPSFDGNLWSIVSDTCTFRWGASNEAYTFEEWRAATGNEAAGDFGPAELGPDFAPTAASDLVIDRARPIPGISTSYSGEAPERGAIEWTP